MGIRKMQKKLQQSQKVPKNGLTEPPFGEYLFVWLVQKNPVGNSVREIEFEPPFGGYGKNAQSWTNVFPGLNALFRPELD